MIHLILHLYTFIESGHIMISLHSHKVLNIIQKYRLWSRLLHINLNCLVIVHDYI